MKTKLMVIGIVLLFCVAGFGQNLTVTAFTGYSMTSFEDQDDAAGTLPLGLAVGYKAAPAIEIGGEFMYPLGGYSWELDFFGETVTTTFNQMMIGAYGKYFIGTGNMKPFVKAGVGYFMGNAKSEGGGETMDFDVDGGIGFNFGGGVLLSQGFSVEFVYNMVSRKIEGDDEKYGMNTWAVLVGYQLVK